MIPTFKNTAGRGENAGDQHFLLFPQCFPSYERKKIMFWVTFNLSSTNAFNLYQVKILLLDIGLTLYRMTKLWLVQIESIRRRQNKCDWITSYGKGGKHCWERRKCWLPAFSPFPTMFSKGFLYRAMKSHDCVGKSLSLPKQWKVQLSSLGASKLV